MRTNESKKITIKDIARESGFSIATVSYVINNRGVYYNKETEKKIKKVIEDLNYVPHAIARQLKKQRSSNIGFIVPYIDDYHSGVHSGIQAYASELGYSVLLFNTNFDPKQEEIFIRDVKEQRFAGLIIANYFTSSEQLLQLKQEIPIVSIGKLAEHLEIPYVCLNDKDVIKEAVNYLVSLGHRRIGIINGPLTIITEKDRFSGYVEALQENNIKIDPLIMYQGNMVIKNSLNESYSLIMSIVKKVNDVTAFMITSDYIALIALKAVSDAGKRVPRDISIIGFDNLPMAEFSIPELTTISQDRFDVGYKSMQMLSDKINGNEVNNEIINARLVVRNSTGKPSE